MVVGRNGTRGRGEPAASRGPPSSAVNTAVSSRFKARSEALRLLPSHRRRPPDRPPSRPESPFLSHRTARAREHASFESAASLTTGIWTRASKKRPTCLLFSAESSAGAAQSVEPRLKRGQRSTLTRNSFWAWPDLAFCFLLRSAPATLTHKFIRETAMDRGGCQMSGGGGVDRVGPEQSGMITLEDLESFSEDQLSDSGNGSLEGEGEVMGEDDNRLLHYWQEAARGHQVEVSEGTRQRESCVSNSGALRGEDGEAPTSAGASVGLLAPQRSVLALAFISGQMCFFKKERKRARIEQKQTTCNWQCLSKVLLCEMPIRTKCASK